MLLLKILPETKPKLSSITFAYTKEQLSCGRSYIELELGLNAQNSVQTAFRISQIFTYYALQHSHYACIMLLG